MNKKFLSFGLTAALFCGALVFPFAQKLAPKSVAADDVWIEEANVEPYAYSLAVIGDTQIVNRDNPEEYPLIYQWIKDNAKSKKIQFAMGLGDITDKDTDEEWARAKESFLSLEGVVPHSQVRGNHDSSAKYRTCMNHEEYLARTNTYYSFLDNTYHTFEVETKVGVIKYLVFAFDVGPDDFVLDWANQVCADHPDHNVIVTTHAYLKADGTKLTRTDSLAPSRMGGVNNGDDMWNEFISLNKNITMVFAGHMDNYVLEPIKEQGVNGNTVTQMLIDPQGIDLTYPTGMITMLYFSDDGKDVQVRWYSPIQDMFYRAENQFTMQVDSIVSSNEPAVEEKAGCMGFVGAEGLISIAVAICAIAKSKKEN